MTHTPPDIYEIKKEVREIVTEHHNIMNEK